MKGIDRKYNKILVVDDDIQDLSYSKSTICNSASYKYTISELDTAFNNNEDIFKYDTGNCLTIITGDNQEFSLHQYQNISEPRFIKLTGVNYSGKAFSIIVSLENNFYISKFTYKWQTNQKLLRFDLTRLENSHFPKMADEVSDKLVDGIDSCIKTINAIIERYNGIDDVPAIRHSMEQKIIIGNTEYQGYLPAIGEIQFLFLYLDLINYVLDYIGFGNHIEIADSLLSSSEHNADSIWGFKTNFVSPWLFSKGTPYKTITFFTNKQIITNETTNTGY